LLKVNKSFVLLTIITKVFSLGVFNFSFILLRASELSVEQSLTPRAYAVVNIPHTATGIPAGILADKIRKEKVIMISYVIFDIFSILITVSINNIAYAHISATVFGLYVGISETIQRAIIPKICIN
jgi:MFS family permease